MRWRTTWSLYLAPTQRLVKPWDKGARGLAWFSAPDLPHRSFEQLWFLTQVGGARAHTDCVSTWRFCQPQSPAAALTRMTPTHGHQGNTSPGLAVHVGIVSFISDWKATVVWEQTAKGRSLCIATKTGIFISWSSYSIKKKKKKKCSCKT